MKKNLVTILTSISCSLVVAFAAVLSGVVYLNARNKGEPNAAPVAIADGEKLYDGDVCAMPQNLTFTTASDGMLKATATSDTTVSTGAVTLTATITPSDAANKNVNWSIAWKNASSTWATGKTVSNYVTLSSSGLTATVTNVAPFGEQIIITCTSAANTSAKATCTVDYVKRVTDVKVTLSSGTVLGEYSLKGRTLGDGREQNVTISSTSFTYGVGTVKDSTASVDFSSAVPYVQVSDAFVSNNLGGLYTGLTIPSILSNFAANENIGGFGSGSSTSTYTVKRLDYSSAFCDWLFVCVETTSHPVSFSSLSDSEKTTFEAQLNRNQTLTGLYWVFTINSDKVGTYEVKRTVKFTKNANFSVSVSGVTLNNNSIEF